MYSTRLIYVCFVVCLCPMVLPGQTTLDSQKKQAMVLEVGGKTLIFGSLAYERNLRPSFSLGVGVGVLNVASGDIIRDLNGSNERGRYFESATSQFLYGNYFWGGPNHQGFVTIGLTHFLLSDRQNYPSERLHHIDSDLEGNLGLGYQLDKGKLFFRATAYVLSLRGNSAYIPDYLPWAGLSMGWYI